ncbi:hypothetical protein GCM10027566_13930 [Arachidicoccus ginsenosidivorans]|jgi:hypothetical protein
MRVGFDKKIYVRYPKSFNFGSLNLKNKTRTYMQQVELIRKGILPIAKMRVEVAGEIYLIAGGKSMAISLPEGELQVKLRLEGWYGVNSVQITKTSSKLIIKPFIPDLLYALGVIFTISFFYFDHAGKLISILLATAAIGIILTIFYFTFLKAQKYFSCIVQ